MIFLETSSYLPLVWTTPYSRSLVSMMATHQAGHGFVLQRDCIAEAAGYMAFNDDWRYHPAVRIKRLAEKIGAQLVAGWCAAKGLDVAASGDAQADRVIAGRRVEIKFSTLWARGVYTFQQIRDQDYDYAVCLGVSPFDAHCWVIPKNLLLQHAVPQHAGRGGKDTFWLSFPANEPPPWLRGLGGKLADAYRILRGWQRARAPR